jgi:hypothetical protein
MISREITNLYLEDFNKLSEAVYLCWHNSFCQKSKQINEEKLRTQIRKHGFYPFKSDGKKELPLSFRDRLRFKTLSWVNCITSSIPENTLSNCTGLFLKAIFEIEQNLLILRTKNERIAYSKMLIHQFNKGNIYHLDVDEDVLNFRLKELFLYVIDHNFVKEDNVTGSGCSDETYPVYNLTVSLINHFDFIDRLVSAFIFFDISIAKQAREEGCNLFMFQDTFRELNMQYNKQNNVLPKFNSVLSDNCLVKIMHYLISKEQLAYTNSDLWLFWFNRKSITKPEPLNWDGSPTMLSNVIQHISFKSKPKTIETIFPTSVYVKPTRKIYESSITYKEIEQIITISNKKTF